MGHAVIVFADGSKQMAHNLDDLRFRWYERRIADTQDAYDLLASNQVIVRYGEPDSISQAQEYIAELKAQAATIQKMYAFIRDSRRTEESVKALNATWIATQEIERERHRLAAWVQRNGGVSRERRHSTKMERIQASNEHSAIKNRFFIAHLKRHIDYLSGLLESAGIEFKPLVEGKPLYQMAGDSLDDVFARLRSGELSEHEMFIEVRKLNQDVWSKIMDDAQAVDD